MLIVFVSTMMVCRIGWSIWVDMTDQSETDVNESVSVASEPDPTSLPKPPIRMETDVNESISVASEPDPTDLPKPPIRMETEFVAPEEPSTTPLMMDKFVGIETATVDNNGTS